MWDTVTTNIAQHSPVGTVDVFTTRLSRIIGMVCSTWPEREIIHEFCVLIAVPLVFIYCGIVVVFIDFEVVGFDAVHYRIRVVGEVEGSDSGN